MAFLLPGLSAPKNNLNDLNGFRVGGSLALLTRLPF
jgi:hypothetical protein